MSDALEANMGVGQLFLDYGVDITLFLDSVRGKKLRERCDSYALGDGLGDYLRLCTSHKKMCEFDECPKYPIRNVLLSRKFIEREKQYSERELVYIKRRLATYPPKRIENDLLRQKSNLEWKLRQYKRLNGEFFAKLNEILDSASTITAEQPSIPQPI